MRSGLPTPSRKTGINSLSRSGEPISAMAQRFEQDADVTLVAAEFGLSPDEFLVRSEKALKSPRAFSSLRIPGGTIKRDVLATMFVDAAVELRITAEAAARRVAESRPAPATNRATSSRTRTPPADPQAESQLEYARFGDLTWGVSALAFSPNGELLAAGKPDRTIVVFDLANKSRASSLEKLESLGSVSQCVFHPTGSKLIAAGSQGQVLIFSVSKEGMLKEIGQFAGHSKQVTCLALSSDGRFAISGGQEKKPRYWEVESGRELETLPALNGPVKAVHLSKNGQIAQVTDGEVLMEYLLNKREVKRQRPLTQSWASGQAAAFSADGEWIAVGDSSKIRVWNTGTGQELKPLESQDIQWSMAFTPDGSRLLSGSTGRVNIWDVRRQQRVAAQATAGTGYVQTLSVSPDGKFFAATVTGQTLQVFRMPKD